MEQGLYRSDLDVDAVADLHLPWWKTWCTRRKTERCPDRLLTTSATYHIRGIASAEGVAYLETNRLTTP